LWDQWAPEQSAAGNQLLRGVRCAANPGDRQVTSQANGEVSERQLRSCTTSQEPLDKGSVQVSCGLSLGRMAAPVRTKSQAVLVALHLHLCP
jgi:hypothetical protein